MLNGALATIQDYTQSFLKQFCSSSSSSSSSAAVVFTGGDAPLLFAALEARRKEEEEEGEEEEGKKKKKAQYIWQDDVVFHGLYQVVLRKGWWVGERSLPKRRIEKEGEVCEHER